MLIMFANFDLISHPSAWTLVWGIEAVTTFIAMMWWLGRLAGPKSPRYYRFLAVTWSWIGLCLVVKQFIQSRIPSPNYSALTGEEPNFIELSTKMSNAWASKLMAISIGYMVVMVVGMLVFVLLYHKTDLFGKRAAAVA